MGDASLWNAKGPIHREVPETGEPHSGRVLAAVQAHADDIPLFCAGTIAKLISEGYTGYLIQTTNDEKCGATPSLGETILANEREVEALAHVLGLERVFHLGYRNHRMDGDSPLELRARLVFLFRLLKIDTVLTFNPWGHSEENPDHWVTARAVEAACWMAGMDKDYPEHLAAGIQPHTVQERYYWGARPDQPYNRVVDISAHEETKIDAIRVNSAQGPGGNNGSQLRRRLAERGLWLPELGTDDDTADREYIRLFLLEGNRQLGQEYGVDCAEPYFHVGGDRLRDSIDRYVRDHAQPLE